jgi:hypothetical protein
MGLSRLIFGEDEQDRIFFFDVFQEGGPAVHMTNPLLLYVIDA